jgi:HYDIN/CFA65/VesB family protein/galactose oxidase-like protein
MANVWTALTGLPPISADTMILLADASVLTHDSSGANGGSAWYRLAPDSLGQYASGTWSGPFNMANNRQFFASGVLKDGRVFVLGGEYSSAGGDTPLGEIFDPLTNTWSSLSKPASFSWINGDVSACILADGRVLVGALQSSRTALWNPDDGTWVEAGRAFNTLPASTKTGVNDEETWTLMANGGVLTVDISADPTPEQYDPATDVWTLADQNPATLTRSLALISLNDTTVSPPVSINIGEIGPAILLPDKRVFVIGATGHTAIYTPAASASVPGTWTAGPDFPADTSGNNFNSTNGNLQTSIDAPAVLLPGGKVLCVAGNTVREVNNGATQFWSNPSTVYVFDPATNALNPLAPQPPSNKIDTWRTRFLLLPTGQVLFTSEQGAMAILTVDPAILGAPHAAWRPVITHAPAVMAVGHHYALAGRQINGLSQANSYGDDAQMGTNYPIVRLTDAANKVTYLRSHLFSTQGVATGTHVEHTVFDIPATLPVGGYKLVVIANGIPSTAVSVQIAAAVPAIVVNPHHGLAFGTTCGGPTYLTLEVFNVGGQDLIVDSVQWESGSKDFSVLPNPVLPVTIAPGEQVDFTVEFQPMSHGTAESATIRIVSNDPVTPNLDLTATGMAGTGHLETIVVDHGNIGRTCLGNFIDQEIQLNNTGPCQLRVLGITSSSADFKLPDVLTFPLVLGAGDSLEVPIRFEPTSLGNSSAVITITSDDPASPKLVRVSATALAPKLALMLADHGDFGHTCVGEFIDKYLILDNAGQCTLEVSGLASSDPDFIVPDVLAYPLTIASGAALEVPIRFKPTACGTKSATLTVTSNDPTGPKQVSVTGEARSGKLVVTGSTYFGEVPCGFAEKTISVCNVGPCDLHVRRVAFRRKRQHFRLINNPFPATLAPGACLGVVIQYWADCEPECCELVVESDDCETPIRCLDVIAYTRCGETCGCREKRSRGGKRRCPCENDDGHHCCDDREDDD